MMATAEQDLQIRLMRLEPVHSQQRPNLLRHDSKLSETNDNNDTYDPSLITCTISSTPLSTAPPYKALSYTWGNPTLTTPILLSGTHVQVTLNLAAALHHILKTLAEPLNLWIDAICINQRDEKEKSEQVGRMREIYSRAQEVITWLGGGNAEGARLAERWIVEFGGRAKALGIGETNEMLLKNVLNRPEASGDGSGGRPEEIEFANDLKRELDRETNARYDDLVAALQDLLQRPYWSRIWVVQEVKMAAKITFMSADGVVDMASLHHALRLLRNFRHWQLVKLGYDASGLALDHASKRKVLPTNPSHAINLLKASRNSSMPMISVLHRLSKFQASDPRDRVFALLGLANDVEQLGLKVDYSLTCEQVYSQLSSALLRCGHFDVLTHCVHEPHKIGSKLKVQSWVRDWAVQVARHSLQERALNRSTESGRTFLQPDFHASGKLVQSHPGAESSDGILSVDSILVGKVSHVEETSRKGDLGHWLQTIHCLASTAFCRHSDPAERTRAVWRTAVADQTVRNHREKPRLAVTTINKLEAVFSGSSVASIQSPLLVDNELGHYAEQMHATSRKRRPFLTSSGNLCIGPEELIVDDHVFVVLGAAVPYVLRPKSSGAGFVFVGEAYVHGCMDGEAADENAVVQRIEIH